MKKLNDNGFGIISLLITISALMILTVMVIPTVSQNITNNQVTTAESTILNLQTDVFKYTNAGGTLANLGIGYQSSAPYGLQSSTYNYLVPVSWTADSSLNASYPYLNTQNGWYSVPSGGFATAYLATAGGNVFTSGSIPQFALGLYAPTMTNAQAATIVNYIQSKETTGAFDEFIWNGLEYTWNATNNNFENRFALTVPLNNSTGNGRLIFGFNGYIQSSNSSFNFHPIGSAIFEYTNGVQYWTVPSGTTEIHLLLIGGSGGDTIESGSTFTPGGIGGSDSLYVSVMSGQTYFIYVAGPGGQGSANAIASPDYGKGGWGYTTGGNGFLDGNYIGAGGGGSTAVTDSFGNVIGIAAGGGGAALQDPYYSGGFIGGGGGGGLGKISIPSYANSCTYSNFYGDNWTGNGVTSTGFYGGDGGGVYGAHSEGGGFMHVPSGDLISTLVPVECGITTGIGGGGAGGYSTDSGTSGMNGYNANQYTFTAPTGANFGFGYSSENGSSNAGVVFIEYN